MAWLLFHRTFNRSQKHPIRPRINRIKLDAICLGILGTQCVSERYRSQDRVIGGTADFPVLGEIGRAHV